MQAWRNQIRAFYNDRLCAILMTALVLIGYVTKTEIVFFTIMTAFVLVGGFVASDARFALMPFLITVFFVTVEHTPGVPTHSTYYASATILPFLIALFLVFFGALAVFAFRNRKRANSFSCKGIFETLALWCISLCIGGAFNAAYTASNFFYALTFPLALLIPYLFFALFVRFDREALDYFMLCLVLAGGLIVLQFFSLLWSGEIPLSENGSISKEHIMLGWAVHNSFAGLLTTLIPPCFYFAAVHKHGAVFYLVGVIEFFAVLLSQSRAATLVGGLILLFCVALSCLFGCNRRKNRQLTLLLCILLFLLAIPLWGRIQALLSNFINVGLDDNGRLELWKNGFDQFFAHPVFGAGFYDHGITAEEVLNWEINVYPYFYHNTVVQMLASAGLVGCASYLYHRYCTLRLFLVRPNLEKSFLALGILAMVLFCMLDVLFFITYPLIYYAFMLLFAQKSEEI